MKEAAVTALQIEAVANKVPSFNSESLQVNRAAYPSRMWPNDQSFASTPPKAWEDTAFYKKVRKALNDAD